MSEPAKKKTAARKKTDKIKTVKKTLKAPTKAKLKAVPVRKSAPKTLKKSKLVAKAPKPKKVVVEAEVHEKPKVVVEAAVKTQTIMDVKRIVAAVAQKVVEKPTVEKSVVPGQPPSISETRSPQTQPNTSQPKFNNRPQYSNNRPQQDGRPQYQNRHSGRPDFMRNRQNRDFRGGDQRGGGNRGPVGPSVTVSPSRLEAAKALYSMEKGAKISDVLELKRYLKPEDEALLRELVYGCTRQKRLLDYFLSSFCTTSYEQLPVEIKIALRLGIYQLYFLDRVPAHAAVHESVNLAKQGGQEKLSGFVNAVLRTAETKKAERVIKGESEIDTLALKYSHPSWIVKRWSKDMPSEQVEQILKANNQPHPVYLRVAPGSRSRVIETLSRQNVQVNETAWPLDTLSLKSHEGGLFSGESFQKGEWIVQDWVPQAMLDLLPLNEGQRVWDVCAAPGGKTIGLAWKTGERGQVMASDASVDRRKRLIENINRIGLKQVSVFDHEITKLSPAQKFDMAWVDAPCSGTGVLSRRADLRWRLMPKDVIEHADQQKDLLVQAQGHLYPKGYLVYSTCSLEKEENQRVVENFIKDYPEFKPVALKVPEGYSEIIADELGLTFFPTAEHDGGFICVLNR